ncbi:MAG: hypothetical protein GOU98_02145 [Candidatus Altiarchaeota archaeon]|nr:hypothetical protein [Candidatus Altiarchaeota archaeon]
MRILLIHADLMEYWSTKATKIAEPDFADHKRVENTLVVFTTVEPGDKDKIDAAVSEIKKVLDWVKCEKAFIYPYAHLSENLSSPKEAVLVLNKLTEKLECERAPFGWYKKFNLHAKGHPMAELSRSI